MNVNELMKSRRTIRKFKQIPIEEKQLVSYIESARVAPSGGNLQPLKYVTVSSREYTDRLFDFVKWAAYLAPDYTPSRDERPTAYVVICADTSIRNSGYEMDAGAGALSIILSALSDGVGCCWMASIDKDKISELLNGLTLMLV